MLILINRDAPYARKRLYPNSPCCVPIVVSEYSVDNFKSANTITVVP
jgi:hypothetical protein